MSVITTERRKSVQWTGLEPGVKRCTLPIFGLITPLDIAVALINGAESKSRKWL